MWDSCGSRCVVSEYSLGLLRVLCTYVSLVFNPFSGCYDKKVYFLDVTCGDTVWTFETGDVVKSSPAVDPKTGLVFAGSHDGYVYALNPLVRFQRCKKSLLRSHTVLYVYILIYLII